MLRFLHLVIETAEWYLHRADFGIFYFVRLPCHGFSILPPTGEGGFQNQSVEPKFLTTETQRHRENRENNGISALKPSPSG